MKISAGTSTRFARSVRTALLLFATTANAGGLADHGGDLFPREKFEVQLHGFLRLRGEIFHNLDLDRGTTPSGRGLYAVPLTDPTAQALTSADMKLRTDVAIYAPFGGLAVKARFDLLDDLQLGSTPSFVPGTGASPTPAASTTQLASSLFRIKWAWGEALTPFGLIAAGRMGNQWGLGMLANSGDCLDCNSTDAADRIAFVTPLFGHLIAAAYDFSAVGPLNARPGQDKGYVLDPSTAVSTVNFALMNVRTEDARKRRSGAGKATFEYGLSFSHRWQDYDVPVSYLRTSAPAAVNSSQVVERGYTASVWDVWAKLTLPSFRLQAEGAIAYARARQATLIPGVLLKDPVEALQWGAAVEAEFGAPDGRIIGGLMAGVASGDPAPGFGAFPAADLQAVPGELDAPQANVPRDVRVDNFRFHPNYRVDRILFAEILGTVTDAIYLRPWLRVNLFEAGSGALAARLAATISRALYSESTPGGDPWLGVEVHPSLGWESKDGFDALFEYAVLFPLGGLDNPAQKLTAQPAQLFRLRLAYKF